MRILSPSILAADFNNLGEQIKAVEEAGAQYLHFDVMDGLFVPSISFGMPVLSSVRRNTKSILDVHLMIQDPIRYVETFAQLGADIITFHLEATDRPMDTINAIRKAGSKVGISIKPHTPVEELKPYLAMVDMVLIMTVEPGFGGQKYIDKCTEKISEVSKMIRKAGLHVDIEIDGGVTIDNVEIPLKAGANIIVAGSAVFRGDASANTRAFVNALNWW